MFTFHRSTNASSIGKIDNGESFYPLISFRFFGGSLFDSLYMMFEAFGFMQERTLRCRNLFSATFGGAALAVSTRFD